MSLEKKTTWDYRCDKCGLERRSDDLPEGWIQITRTDAAGKGASEMTVHACQGCCLKASGGTLTRERR